MPQPDDDQPTTEDQLLFDAINGMNAATQAGDSDSADQFADFMKTLKPETD